MNPDQLFESVASALEGDPNITKAKMFGAPGLKIGGKFFACLFKGNLVLKLPQKRVADLVASGVGESFDPGMGRVMKEWVAIEPRAPAEWMNLTKEAREFVSSKL